MQCDYFLKKSNLFIWTKLGALFGKIPFQRTIAQSRSHLVFKIFLKSSQGFQNWNYYLYRIWNILKNYEWTKVKSYFIYKKCTYLPCIESSLISFHKFDIVDHNQSLKLHFQQYLYLSRLCTDHIDIQQCKQKIENTLVFLDTKHSVLVRQCIENNYFFGSNHQDMTRDL